MVRHLTKNFTELIERLDRFIKKFYLYKTLRGLIIFTAIISTLFLSIVLLQYFFYFSVPFKTFVFWSFLLISLIAFFDYVFFPLLKFFKIGKVMSYELASNLIVEKFPEIKDKLINILELARQYPDSNLAIASIDQKINEIKIFDFQQAVSFYDLLRFAKYLIFPVLILIYLLLFNIQILNEGTKRFLAYNVYFEKPAPFSFILLNKSLNVRSGDTLNLSLKVEGQYLPKEVYIHYSGNRFLMLPSRQNRSVFTYTFPQVNQSFQFYFEADGYNSKLFKVNVLPSPEISDFKITIIPPDYTHLKQQTLTSITDLVIPQGSKLILTATAYNLDSVFILVGDSVLSAVKVIDNKFLVQLTVKNSSIFKVLASNPYFKKLLLLKLNIVVVPDLPPDIKVFSIPDSMNFTNYYFKGIIADDYGFTSLSFNYAVFDKDEKIDFSKFKSISIPFLPALLNQDFYFSFDFSQFAKNKGKVVKYFFKVVDNDKVNGFKSTITPIYEFYVPDQQYLDSLFDTLSTSVGSKLQEAYQLAYEIQKEIEDYKIKSLSEDVSEWEKISLLNDISVKSQKLQSLIDELKQENQYNLQNLEKFSSEKYQDLLKKQQELQKLLDELLTDDIKKLMEEIQKLQSNFNDKNFKDLLNKMQFSYKNLEKRLDRNLELMKRLKLQQDIMNLSERFSELSKKQDSLSNVLKKSGLTPELKQEQQKLQQQYEDLQNQYENILEKNDELKSPMNLQDFLEEFSEIDQDFQQTQENMKNSKKSKTLKSMQKTSQDLKQLSQKMNSMLQSLNSMQNAEDLQTMKFLLSAILDFSFTQESLYVQLVKAPLFTKKYNLIHLKQVKLQEDFRIIEDSLYALAERNPAVNTLMLSELSNIEKNFSEVITYLDKNKKDVALVGQRKILESANKLALLFDESIQNMQSMMSSAMGSSQQNNNGSSIPNISDLKKFQESLRKSLEQLYQQLQQQKQNGQNDPELAKKLAQQLAEREQFEKMLQDLLNNSTLSPEEARLLREIQQINDKIKSDVINRNITPQTLMRQHQIMTRLLEAEKAEMERKYSKQRQSKTADNNIKRNPKEIEEFFKKYFSTKEVLKFSNLKLNRFYNQYYNSYLNKVSKQTQK